MVADRITRRHAHNYLLMCVEFLWGHAHLSSRSFQLLSFVTVMGVAVAAVAEADDPVGHHIFAYTELSKTPQNFISMLLDDVY